MTRVATITTVYALLAAILVAAPLAASEQPAPPATGDEALAGAPVEPAAEQPAEPVTGPAEPAPAPPAPAAAPQVPAAAQPPPAAAEPGPASPPAAPAEAPPAEPAEARDPAPGPKLTVAAAASGSVTISDFQFAPASITVDVGDTVTWSNAGPTAHSATATGGSFDTGIFSEGQSRSHTFDQAGTFAYICTPHPQMKGTVTVRAAAAQGGGEEAPSGDTSGSATDTGSATTTDDTQSAAAGAGAATLPSTGLDGGGLLALGVITLALGVLLRRRAARTG